MQSHSSGRRDRPLAHPEKRAKLQIIDYDIVKDEDSNKEEGHKSPESQKSYNEMANAKFEGVQESFDQTPVGVPTAQPKEEVKAAGGASRHAD